MIEKQLHFNRDCQWKEFKFRVGYGGLKSRPSKMESVSRFEVLNSSEWVYDSVSAPLKLDVASMLTI